MEFVTRGYNACCVKFSPFFDNRLLIGASANFGLVGNGRIYVIDAGPSAQFLELRHFDTQDSVTGVAWSEIHENQFVAACGDGKLRLFDVGTDLLGVFAEHAREVFSVDWSSIDKSQFLSSSWDGTIKLWMPNSGSSLLTLRTPGPPGSGCVYQARYHPANPSMILSAHADSYSRVWDARAPNPEAAKIPAVLGGDCLACDWNKYTQTLCATSGSDRLAKVWDIRNLGSPVTVFNGHQLPVKQVRWSPHSALHLLTTSYDMTAKVWLNTLGERHVVGRGPQGLIRSFSAHTEFVTDGDWCLWGEPGWVATTGWDQKVYLWRGFDAM